MREYEQAMAMEPSAGGPDPFTLTGVITRLRGQAESISIRLEELEKILDPIRVSTPERAIPDTIKEDTPIQSPKARAIEESLGMLSHIEHRLERLTYELDK